jgi:hypothetical protein
MKVFKIIIGVLLSLVILTGSFLAYNLYINPKSPKGVVDFKNDGKEIRIEYYRPYKNERLIFGESDNGALVPYGFYWRLGANLTTKITTNKDLDFAGRNLPKGTYGLYAYPYAENWVVIIHKKTGRISFSEPDPASVLMKINLPVQKLDKSLEQFTIDFVESSLRMRWDKTKVVIPIN